MIAEQLVDRRPLVGGERVLVLHGHGRQVGQHGVDPGLHRCRIGAGRSFDVDDGIDRRDPAGLQRGWRQHDRRAPMNGLRSTIPATCSSAGPAGRPTVTGRRPASPRPLARSTGHQQAVVTGVQLPGSTVIATTWLIAGPSKAATKVCSPPISAAANRNGTASRRRRRRRSAGAMAAENGAWTALDTT